MSIAERDAVLAADAAFFAALLAADAVRLEALLTDDFQIVDVNQGAVTGRVPFIGFVASGVARFDAIDTEPAECLVRHYGAVAVAIGATSMRFRLENGGAFSARSRYTHVFVRAPSGEWRLASAQGTRIEG